MIDEITVEDLNSRLKAGENLFVLDVREEDEYEAANMGATLIPLGELESRLGELEAYRNSEFVVHCRSGARSARACAFLKSQGFAKPVNLKGGIMEWARVIDPSLVVF